MAYAFCTHSGHLTEKANKIAKRHGGVHVNHTEPGTSRKRGWFELPNRGWLHDEPIAKQIMSDIEAAGGLDAMRKK